MDDTDNDKPEITREAKARYQAFMQRRFEQSSYKAECRAKFQARKDAKLARDRAAKAGAPMVHQVPSSVPPLNSTSGSEDVLSAWNPRKHRHKDDSSPRQPAGNDDTANSTAVKNEHPLSTRGSGMQSAATSTRAVDPAIPDIATKQNNHNTAPDTTRAFPLRIGSPPKSRQSSSASETLPERRKRSADTILHDDRRPSYSKQVKRNSTAALPQPPRRTGADRQPPLWYQKLPTPNGTRDSKLSSEETSLTRIKVTIKSVKDSHAQNLAAAFADILDGLHRLSFLPVTAVLLRKTRMLTNADGLPQLIDKEFSGGVDWPWYLRADAEELYNKWYTGVFETDMYRGVERGLKVKGKSKTLSGNYDKLQEGSERFRLVDPKEHGNGLLINGTWWPTQLTVLRDGGHGSSQGGITSHPEAGAFSVIIAGGLDSKSHPYPNVDHGEEVLYCGSDNHNDEVNEPSRETRAMILNHETKQPVRLFRSSNLASTYAPEQGFRYDGLYQVAGIELMDPPEATRNRHRFRLLRCDGQDPIRYEGLAKRPTKEELEEYEKDKKNRGR